MVNQNYHDILLWVTLFVNNSVILFGTDRAHQYSFLKEKASSILAEG
jgi:hypothetical protein